MKKILKIFGITFASILTLFIALAFAQTYRNNRSNSAEQFAKGKLPSPSLDGFQKGSANFYTGSWQGKTFDVHAESGINNFGTGSTSTEKYSFKTYTGTDLQSKNLEVFKIDYQNGKNSWWISPLLDEVVEVAPGQYLGKIYYRLIPKYPFVLGYFNLENNNPSDKTIRNITVSSKYFTIKLPQNWQVDFNPSKDLLLSEMIALSPNFKGHSEKSSSTSSPETLNYFESGAKMDIIIEKGLVLGKEKVEGSILSSEDITVAGIKSKLLTIKESSTKLGQILDVRFVHEGNSYVFRLAYNSENFAEAQKTFKEFLSTFKLVNAKK